MRPKRWECLVFKPLEKGANVETDFVNRPTVPRSPRRVWGRLNKHLGEAKIASAIHLSC